MICCRLKCNITYILWNRKNAGIIDIFGITCVECEIVYNKFEVIRTWYSTLWSPSYNYCCIRYRVTNFNKLFMAIQNVKWPYNNMLDCWSTRTSVITIHRVTTCLENLEMWGNLSAVRDFTENQGIVRENVVREKLPKTVYCKLHICVHTGI